MFLNKKIRFVIVISAVYPFSPFIAKILYCVHSQLFFFFKSESATDTQLWKSE